ncbi:MAG: right-handed parallel beta-helix repeat-containing protein, partial [Thermodesulfobacteriota bacterium]|nr:right-handed parallel beta-helix repeat-containing protein [Thermodesulfobacteriota bacterium]
SLLSDKKVICSVLSDNNEFWQGIIFDSVKRDKNLLEFCRVKDSDVGVECRSSSPEIRNCEFVNNGTALKIMGGFSNPCIDQCIIRDNRVTGIEVTDGAKASIKFNQIKNNDNNGLLIQDAGSVTVTGNTIINNRGSGIVVKNSQSIISQNNIYDNLPFEMEGSFRGKAASADDNWWGKADWHDLFAVTNGRIHIRSILDSAYPDGKSIRLPVLTGTLDKEIDSDSILAVSNSPYRVSQDLIIDKGAALYIQPGVKVLFDKQASIIAKDGGIVARSIKDNPIIFTSSGSSPSPGDYINAIQFSEPTKVSSFFKYCVFEYATTAIDIRYGMPEIAYCHIVNNSQSGVRCGNDAGPRILYNTIEKNLGTGGIECVGMAKPIINFNNFLENVVAIQTFSSIYIDARHNFWGKVPPDNTVIWGENIDIEPWLEAPGMDAFSILQEKGKPTIFTTEDTETTER